MKEKDNDILGGFSAIFDQVGANDLSTLKDVEVMDDPYDAHDTEYNPFNINVDPVEDDDNIDKSKLDNDVDSEPPAKNDNDKSDDNSNAVDDAANMDDEPSEQVVAFFDAIAESVGWTDVPEDEKPKTVEDLVGYMKSVVESNSKPEYASDDVAKIDEFVKSGGKIEDYFDYLGGVIDYDNIDISDERTQRVVLHDFLLDKGFTEAQIQRKLEKYEDADLLEDEASDALEYLKVDVVKKKEALLEAQKNSQVETLQAQQNFYNNVVGEIEALTDVRGIKIPKQDKQALMEYIFKVDNDGRTKYQKDYASKTKNLIESAYFTMKGDVLIDNARKDGETNATEKLRRTLNSNKVGGSKSKINNGSPTPLWSVASSQLLRRPQ